MGSLKVVGERTVNKIFQTAPVETTQKTTTGASAPTVTVPTVKEDNRSGIELNKDALLYGAGKVGTGILGALEGVNDAIGSTFYKGVEGLADLAKSTPFYQNWVAQEDEESSRGAGRNQTSADETSWLTKLSNFAEEKAQSYLDNSITKDLNEKLEEKFNPTQAMQIGGSINETVASLLPGVGVSSAIGATGTALNAANQASKAANAGKAVFGLQAAGNAASESKAEGATTNQALLYGATSGLLETTIESIAGGIPQLGKGAVSTIANKLTSNPAVSKVLDIVGEGGEEALSTFLTPYIKRAVYDENAENATAEEIGQSAAMGIIASGILQGGLTLPGAISNHTNTKTASTPVQSPTTPTNTITPISPLSEQKTAPDAIKSAEAEYRAEQPQNVEYPTVPIINLSMQDVAKLNNGTLPNAGNGLRNIAVSRARVRLGLDKNSEVYIPASNVTRNGEEYVLKITRSSLNKMLSPSNGGVVAPESIAVLENIERIANNGVYFRSEGDRQGRDQIAGYDHLMTTVYIDNQPYVVDMRVRLVQQTPSSDTENVLYYFTPEEIVTVKKIDADLPTGKRRALTMSQETASTSDTKVTQVAPGVNTQYTQNNSSAFMPGSGLENTVDGYGPNTVGSAQAQFKYQEAPTQSVGSNLFTEQEMQENPELQNTHQVLTNAEGRAIAGQMLANEYDSEVERLKTDEWGAVEQVEGYQILSDLVDKARETGDYSEAVEWKKLFDRKGTEAGQALQARAQFTAKPEYIVTEAAETLNGDNVRRMSDEKKRAILDNVEKQANTYDSIQEGDTSSLIALIERNNEIRRTTGLFSKKTAKQMDWALNEVVKNYPETAEQFLRDVAVSQIRSISSDYQKLSPLEAVKNYRIMGMLSKASTVMRNLVSNNVFDPLESLSNDVGIIADGIMSIATGQRTTAVDKSWFSKAKRSGSLEGALKSYIQVGLDADVGESSSRYETGDNRTFKMTGNFLERLLSTWSKYENYALKTTDEFQKGGIAAETQRGIEQLQQSGKLAEGMLPGWAEETAKQRTFQNEGAIAEAMVGLRSAANKLSIKDKQGGSIGVGDVMLPFARVPGNLVAQAANYSPLGIANGLREITNVMVEAKKGNYSAEAQAQAARNFGRGVTGTGLLAGFAALAAKGLIDVAGADDKDKEALEKAQGRTGTQWNLSATMRAFNGESTEWQDGDTLMSIGFLDPINSIMAASALISDAYAEDNNLTIGEIANASFSSLVQSILDLPAMSSISSLIDAYTYAEGETAGEKAANAALDYAGSQASSFLLPNALKGVASGLDDTVRNQYTGETIGEGVVDSLKYGIPGPRETLPASLDPFGREKTQTGNDVLNMLNNNLLPGAITKYSETKVEGALEDLYDQTGASGIYPNKSAPTSITIDKNKVQLDADQQATYQRTAGQTAEEIMSDMMDTKTFRNASDSEKAEYLELANKYARAVAAGEATNGKYEADKYVELAQTAKKELGLTEAEYLMLYQDYGGTIMNGDKLREAYDAGIKVQDYLDYYTTASKYDADKNGSYTIVERGTSIQQSGLSDESQQALWSMYYPEWKDKATNVGVSYETYIDYKYITNKAGASKKADKIAALQAAGYSYNEAVNLYSKIK